MYLLPSPARVPTRRLPPGLRCNLQPLLGADGPNNTAYVDAHPIHMPWVLPQQQPCAFFPDLLFVTPQIRAYAAEKAAALPPFHPATATLPLL